MRVAFVVALAVLLTCTAMLVREVAAANKCCNSVFYYPDCNDCQPYFLEGAVRVGNNSTKACQTTTQAAQCSEHFRVCFDLTDATLYLNINCSTGIGFVDFTREVQQCDMYDAPCGSG